MGISHTELQSRSTLQEIFNPIVEHIDGLVNHQVTHQVTQARLKRLQERHPNGQEITASNVAHVIAAPENLTLFT